MTVEINDKQARKASRKRMIPSGFLTYQVFTRQTPTLRLFQLSLWFWQHLIVFMS